MDKTIVLTEKELESVIIFERIKNKELSQEEAAKLLNLSSRQVRRKYKRYCKEGSQSVIHKKKGQPSNRAIKEEVQIQIIEIIKSKYSNLPKPATGPTFLSELLQKNHQINIDHDTLRRLMIKHNLWETHNRKARRHVWRERKHHWGEMIQGDGSRHIWFGDDYSTLIAFIDDATSQVLAAKFVDHESVKNLAQLTEEYVKKYGRPLSLYTDRGSTYKVNTGKDLKRKTQFQRMLKDLSIELIHARSPQAKGRVERLFKTLQDRLVKELTLEKITTNEAANKYLQEVYLPRHNGKFAVRPFKSADFHKSIDGFDLSTIFCRKYNRIINNDRTISFNSRWFQLDDSQPAIIREREFLTVHEDFDGTIRLFKQEKPLVFHEILKPVKVSKKGMGLNNGEAEEVMRRKGSYKPPRNHPWRGNGNWPGNPGKTGHF